MNKFFQRVVAYFDPVEHVKRDVVSLVNRVNNVAINAGKSIDAKLDAQGRALSASARRIAALESAKAGVEARAKQRIAKIDEKIGKASELQHNASVLRAALGEALVKVK